MKRITDPDAPDRCQGITARGQCQCVREAGSDFCSMHGGTVGAETLRKREMRNYRLTKFKARTDELAANSNLASLRDEVAILRMMIEEKVNSCQDSQHLLLMSGPLSDLIMKCGVLVEKCQRLESRLGNHLDRTKVTQLAQVCVEIIASHLDDNDIDEVSDQIFKALGDV